MAFRHPSRLLSALLASVALAFAAAPALAPDMVDSAPVAHGVQNGLAAMVDLATERDAVVLARRANR